MGVINDVRKLTDLSYVNLYQLKATSIHNTPVVCIMWLPEQRMSLR